MTTPAYITTSWDDGHPLDLRLAELLHKYGLPATFYIPLDNKFPLMTPPQMRELSAGFELGAHTVHHCDLLTMPDDVARREITDCKSALEQITGRPCTAFCFPKGHFRRNHVRQVREAGYRMARTVELMSLEMPRLQDGVAIMPTTLQAGPAGSSRVARNSLKRLRPMNLFRHVRYRKSDWVATADAMVKHVLTRGGVFHLWGHSWEIHQMDQWQNLEWVFAMLAQCKRRAIFTDNSGLVEATSKSAMPRVFIIQSQMKQYRVPFFEKLHETLVHDGITLRVAYSAPSSSEAKKGDNQDLPAEYGVKTKGFWFLGEKILYQPLLPQIFAADMIIVEQANKHMLNYLLFALSTLRIKKVAFWGHGRNTQPQGQIFGGWLKHTTLNYADWWFAYTDGTARYLVQQGVPPSKITNVQNAVDTTEFRRMCADISPSDAHAARRKLNIPESAKVGLFCGGIFRDKLPEFLIESARKIRQCIPNFELLIVGAGPMQGVVEAAVRDAPWIHSLGPQFGREKALLFRLADVFLMPGLVGLAILDAFSAGLPIMTSSVPFHSPEIEYLEEGRNGVVTAVDSGAYSDAVIHLLSDVHFLQELKNGAFASSKKYTLESMVERFHSGIARCLRGPDKTVESNQEHIDRPHYERMSEL